MEFSIEFGGDDADVTVTTWGRADVDGFRRLDRSLVGDPRYRPGMSILADHSALHVRELTHEEMQQIGRNVVGVGELIGPSPVAIVVKELIAYGLTRMWQAYSDPAPMQSNVFYSRAEACSWLRDVPPPATR